MIMNTNSAARGPQPPPPLPAKRAVQKLGRDIRDARRRRRIPTTVMAERASISRISLIRVERGDTGVSMGIYAAVLMCLGMVDRLADVADPRHDAVGMALAEEQLPVRIRLPRRKG
jgi:hypothetical protein